MAGFLADKGVRVLANGFDVIPITPGEKFPLLDGWRTIKTTPAIIAGWLRNGHAKDGIGIRTDHTPLIDIDVFDKVVGDRMQDFIETTVGFAPVRFGNTPKRGMLFRSDRPFRKLSSKAYVDSNGRKAQIEILGEGQQFVAFHIHPDTRRPYYWLRNDSPETNTVDDLPELTKADAHKVIEEFERLAAKAGWRLKQALTTGVVADPLDEWELGTEALGLDDAELRRKVMLIPNGGDDVDYEGPGLTWLNMMAAVHHETGGSDTGYEIALGWSEQSNKHEAGRFDKTWNSFGKREGPQVTARLILKLAREHEQIAVAEQVAGFVDRLGKTATTEEIRPIAAEIRQVQLDNLHFANVVGALKTAFKRLTHQILGIKEARGMIRYRPDELGAPDWLENWTYLKHIDQFFNAKTKEILSQKAFDNAFGRFLDPDSLTTPSLFALHRVKIPVVHMAIYMPAEDTTFTMNGREYINTYDDSTAALTPDRPTNRDRQNIERVKTHFSHLFTEPRDRRILTSWLASIVQTQQRPNWAIVLQGVEGDGRTFLAHMMAAVLGGPNVYTMDAKTLESPFNEWAQGHLLTCIEEIRLVGHNRYDILNRIKPLITNSTIEIHPKRMNTYNCPNTSAYFAMTNYRNALPITDNDRRYFILMSRWQDSESLSAFMSKSPTYYDDLYTAIEESAGAIRGWLERYPLDPEFKRQGRAPFSHGREQMAALSKSDESIRLVEILSEGTHPDVCNELVVVSSLIAILGDDSNLIYSGQIIKTILSEAGFDFLGRVRIKGERQSVWSKTPEKWSRNLTTRNEEIRAWTEDHL